ncbi:MAG TPA: flap structure-specific endonuclease [Candidatus Thermoplasmatota archaeon]|nr:flap structure-specific endonuclease [Candidatus Thermoplasmatota archaeon]
MGIDLGDVVVRRPTTLAHYAGKRVAIDAWNILYQFLSSIRQPDGTPLMDGEGRITSHLAGTLYRTANLVEAGIRPVFVFDGVAPELKKETLAARAERKVKAAGEHAEARPAVEAARQALAAATTEPEREAAERHLRESEARSLTKAQQTSRLTAPMVTQAQDLLRALGIPVVQATGEGEAQASWMCREGLVDAAVSQDFDALLFGTPLLVRHLATGGKRKMPGKQVWADVTPEEVPLQDSLEALGLTHAQLVDVALLVGTDFHPGIKGIGAKKAIPLVKKDGSLEALLARLAANPASASSAAERAILEQRDALEDRDAVRAIFLQPDHAAVSPPDLAMKGPDADAVRAIMVDRHGFGRERVDTALARYGAGRARQAQKTLF